LQQDDYYHRTTVAAARLLIWSIMPIEESEYSGCEFFTDKYVSKGKVSLCGIYQSKKVGTTTMKTFQFSAPLLDLSFYLQQARTFYNPCRMA
jgi:hypothetical protein